MSIQGLPYIKTNGPVNEELLEYFRKKIAEALPK